jgi:alanine racemase
MNPTRQRIARTALTWVEVDTAALLSNLHAFRRRLGPGVELAHVVKSDAYGHGLELVAAEDAASGIVHRLAVISVDELVRVRAAGVKLPVVILGYVPLSAWDAVVDAEGSPVVFNLESLHTLSRVASERGREIGVHLKVETGTYRYGIPASDLPDYLELVRSLPGLRLDGLTTHFANIEDTTDHGYAQEQLDRFRHALTRVREAGFEVPVPHAACSAATILFPESHFAMARVGISSYGIWPSKETHVSSRHVDGAQMDLRPVLAWKTRIAQVKSVPAGGMVGYGCTWKAPADSRIAVLPIGYADGYDRGISNVGHVLIGGRRAPVRGRVCMNVTMVDVTHHPDAALEDEVVLIGRQGDEAIRAEDLASWCGTIAYEIVSRIGGRIPRVRVQG